MDHVEIKVGLNHADVRTGAAAVKNQLADMKNSAHGGIGASLFHGAKEQIHEIKHELKNMAIGGIGGAFLGAGIFEGFKSVFEQGVKIAHLSERFGAPAEGLQRIGNAASLCGASLEDVAVAMNKLVLAQDKVRIGGDDAAKGLKALKIDGEAFINMNPEQAMYAIADAVKNSEDHTAAYAAVIALLGKKAGVLFETLMQGGASIREIGEAMGVFSDEAVEKFDRIEKQWAKNTNHMKVMFGDVLSFTLSGLNQIWQSLKYASFYVQNKVGYISDSELALRKMEGEESVAEMDSPAEHDHKGHKHIELDETEDDSKKREAGEKRILSLTERLAEMKRRAMLEELDGQEKIAELVREQADAALAADMATDPEDKLQKQIKLGEADRELHSARQRADDEAEAKAKRITGKREQLSEKEFRANLESMSPAEKRAALMERQHSLAEKIAGEGDEEKKLGLQEKYADTGREIAHLDQSEQKPHKAGRIYAEGQTAFGAGYAAYSSGKPADAAKDTADAAKDTVDLLESANDLLGEIRDKVGKTQWEN